MAVFSILGLDLGTELVLLIEFCDVKLEYVLDQGVKLVFVLKNLPDIYDFVFFQVDQEEVQCFQVILIFERHGLAKSEDQLCMVGLRFVLLFHLLETSFEAY